MSSELHPPLAPPKNGQKYEITAFVRVSDPKPGKQDWRSLEDQEKLHRDWLDRHVGQPYNLSVIAGSGSGELLDRKELQQLTEVVETRRVDLVICEDLGRIIRRMHAHMVCEHCEDFDTRLFSKNDRVDTALPNWREASIFASFHHERSNRDTSDRIKRTLRNRFVNGGSLRTATYGIIKPAGAKNDTELTKDPAAESIYKKWFEMLDVDDATYADVARYLRSESVLFPSRIRGQLNQPDAKSVARYTFNPILKGVREHNHRKTRRVNDPGKYVSFKASKEDLLQRAVPHLAFFEAAYYDRVVAKVRERNRQYRRTDDPATDPCLYRPRKESRWPGRVTYCAICGRQFVWGGHGQTDRLMCNGARQHRCWVGATFDGPMAARRIAELVMSEVAALREFDTEFLAMLKEEGERLDVDRAQRSRDRQGRLTRVAAMISNLLGFITDGRCGPSVATELERLESEQARLRAEVACLAQQPSNTIQIPSADEIRKVIRASLKDLAIESAEFARIMRKLVPRIVVFPVRLRDGGPVVLRARFHLRLASLLPDIRAVAVLQVPLSREPLSVDLFDPPQREQFRRRIVAARATGKTQAQIAEECRITVTAAQRAAGLQRQMDKSASDDPYVPVLEARNDSPKRRRDLHPDYHFEALPGAGQL